ncbi:MAG: hypothetical protein GY760_12160, partial [Deltaproteobacteria bacterium]|nr:hypothetical protein [Deltaproteobacteria bacterium]
HSIPGSVGENGKDADWVIGQDDFTTGTVPYQQYSQAVSGYPEKGILKDISKIYTFRADEDYYYIGDTVI